MKDGSEDLFKIALGKRITDLRNERAVGLRKFALIADMEHHQLIDIEKGRRDPRILTLRKIAAAFEMSLPELLSF
ncbi:XRE family transcriptional regulator [Pedobacter yulinensis]|uniref:XRE family transcriptional regulator n=1 Tax=Pedobacter yulinensis TaxID=2126353 RepID=A0A2T3HRG2_9SPHI|nr:helix-turn-helix transcriptional regulator [Pedobacter yulinensis]PST84977.1 XRE family transcriptional regulator [Pedobacter yulinensis]